LPIYEYQCAACGRITEKWQKFSDLPLTICPHCRGSLSKLISSCSFRLKGSGWYVSDYGGSRQESAKSEKPGEAQEAKGAEDRKPQESAKSEASSPSKIT
jgi:putative FmdB family regulatory protein